MCWVQGDLEKEVFAGESFTGECEGEIEGLGESAIIVLFARISHFKLRLNIKIIIKKYRRTFRVDKEKKIM
jgi:hypothetical protein